MISPEYQPDRFPAERLHAVIADGYLHKLGREASPLSLAALNRAAISRYWETVEHPEFQEVMGQVGWPEGNEYAGMGLRRQYESDEEFGYYLHHATADPDKGLNNFRMFFVARPHTPGKSAGFGPGVSMADIAYGTHPALWRARLVAPRLCDELHGLLGPAYREHGEMRFTQREVVSGLHLAYRLMGRLVTPFDIQYQADILDAPRPDELISDVHKALTT